MYNVLRNQRLRGVFIMDNIIEIADNMVFIIGFIGIIYHIYSFISSFVS